MELVQAAEATGFESASTVEHTMISHGYQSAYPYMTDGRLPGGEGDLDRSVVAKLVRLPRSRWKASYSSATSK